MIHRGPGGDARALSIREPGAVPDEVGPSRGRTMQLEIRETTQVARPGIPTVSAAREPAVRMRGSSGPEQRQEREST
jgi:hypothetical protein